ncbi:hypothetical protein [Gemmatimonas sp.]|jgi:hypothetical protein|uniref:hypothetical protein n=1 Tax=Gemmatimonas sp. TaxID=1962908 RepID=UPI0033401EDC
MSRPKIQRQVAAQVDKMQRKMMRVSALSVSLIQSQVLFHEFERAKLGILGSYLPDEVLVQNHLTAVHRVEVDDYARADTFLSYFLGSLYAVTEKWREWRFEDNEVDALLASPNLAALAEHRHSIFHGDSMNEQSALALLRDDGMMQWCVDLMAALKSSLLEWNTQPETRMRRYLNETYNEPGA